MREAISKIHVGSVFSVHDGALSLAAHAGSAEVNTAILKTAMPRPRTGTGEVLSDGPSAVLAGVEKGAASTAIGIPSAAAIAGRIAPGAALIGGANDAINVGQHVAHGAGAEAMTEGLGVVGQAGGAVAGAELGLWLLTPLAVVLGPAAPPIGAFLGGVGGAFVGAQGAKSIGAYLTGGDTPDKLGPPLTLPNHMALTPTVTTSNGSRYSLVEIEGRYTWFSIHDNPALPHRFVEVVSGAKTAELTGHYLQAVGFEAQLAQAHAQLAEQQREALREAFVRNEIQSANSTGPNGLPWGTPSAIGTNATQTWLQSPQPGQALNILEVRNADGSVSRIEQEVDRTSGGLLGEKSYENPDASKADGFRLVATSDHLRGVHWTLNRQTGLMERANIAPRTSGEPAFEEGFAPDGSPLGRAATVTHEGAAYTTVWARDAASGQYIETETTTHRDSAGEDMAPTTIIRSYGADGTALSENTSQVLAQPAPIPSITTHEQRIIPTPGGMPFAEAHKRRDEPEQISVGSLQAVGKLDASTLVKGSPSYRMHQAQEQDLMRGLALAQQQDRERFRHEPSPSLPSVSRTQERTQGRLLSEMPVQKQFEPEVKIPAAPSRQQTSALAIPAAAPRPVGVAPPVLPAFAQSAALPPAQPISSHEQRTIMFPQPTAQAGAGDSPEMQARWAAKEAELVAAREQIARLTRQSIDERPADRTEPAAPMRQTDPRDPAHPDHKDFQKIYGVVAQHGRWDAQQSASIASQALADFKAQPLSQRLDVVALEPDTNGRLKLLVGHAPWGGLRCLSSVMVDPVQAARVPAEQGFDQLAQATQRRELQAAQQWSQQQQQGNDQGLRR
ncbi:MULTISPECIES: XVIPCD domain-containing protein [unclassified Variovorax]|uniref:XVIPCD domain-containing protein n=1 Tax=unclassified Variovorax TaxID=663243 RepID=UPI002577D93A|nr:MULTISPECIES: XVIPCD domain-containing protein [unclassified Variovorax]MDM0089806.1 hypothetical protein [Variovorax sp. J22G40]MDM0148528.1 hypothetical protein [Variovorax sp. J2P1-31]